MDTKLRLSDSHSLYYINNEPFNNDKIDNNQFGGKDLNKENKRKELCIKNVMKKNRLLTLKIIELEKKISELQNK